MTAAALARAVAVAALLGNVTGCNSLPDLRRSIGGPPADSMIRTPAAATPRRPARRRADAADPRVAAMRYQEISRALRRLVAGEEGFFAENGTYTRELERAGLRARDGIQIRFLWLSRDGWAASGTHPDLLGRDCVIYVGHSQEAPTTLKNLRQGREGVPVCDQPPALAATPRRPPEAATAPAPAAAVAETISALDLVDPVVQMKVDLRNLARSQETYYGTQGIYARRTEPLAIQFLWHKGVTVTILSAAGDSWSARATHAKRPGKSCVIWVGPVDARPATAAQHRSADRPATPSCDS